MRIILRRTSTHAVLLLRVLRATPAGLFCNHMSPARVVDFWDRIQRGNNVTKIGNSTNPRDVAGQIAAQARAAVDCPFLQCVGPQSTNQGLKAIAIARTYLQQSDQSGDTCHPDIVMYVCLSVPQLVLGRLAPLLYHATHAPDTPYPHSRAGTLNSCTSRGTRISPPLA